MLSISSTNTQQATKLDLLKVCLLLLLSTLLLIFSFLPIMRYTYRGKNYFGEYLNGVFEIKITPMQNITFMLDSFENYSDIEKSSLYWEYEKIEDDIWDAEENGVLTSQEEKTYSEFFLLCARLTVQGQKSRIQMPFIMGALTSLLYITLIVLLWIHALLALLASVKQREYSTKRVLMLLCAVPFAAMLTYYATATAMYGTYLFVEADVSIGSGIILNVVFSTIALVLWGVGSWISQGAKINFKRQGCRLAVLALSLFALATVFMPSMVMSLTAKFDGQNYTSTIDVPYDSGYFAALECTSDELSYYKKNRDGYFSANGNNDWTDNMGYLRTINYFDNYSINEYSSGTYAHSIDTYLRDLFSFGGGYEIYRLMNLMPFFAFITAIAFATLAWQQTYALISGKNKKSLIQKGFSIGALVAAIIALILVAVFVGTVMSDIRLYTDDPLPSTVDVKFKLSLGASTIWMVLMGAILTASAFIPKLRELECSHVMPSSAPQDEENAHFTPWQKLKDFIETKKQKLQKNKEEMIFVTPYTQATIPTTEAHIEQNDEVMLTTTQEAVEALLKQSEELLTLADRLTATYANMHALLVQEYETAEIEETITATRTSVELLFTQAAATVEAAKCMKAAQATAKPIVVEVEEEPQDSCDETLSTEEQTAEAGVEPQAENTQKTVDEIVFELKQFKELLDCNIITQEEFDRKKNELLHLAKKN